MEVVRPIYSLNLCLVYFTVFSLFLPSKRETNDTALSSPSPPLSRLVQSTTFLITPSLPLTTPRGMSPAGPSFIIPSTSPFRPRNVHCESPRINIKARIWPHRRPGNRLAHFPPSFSC